MSGSNCSFLTCIQVSQETSKVVWYSHLFKNFPQFVVIPTIKGFSAVNVEKEMATTPVFLPGESCGRRSLVGCVHRVAQSRTQLKRLSMHACIGEGNSNQLQYSCLENPRDRGAWWAAIYGVTQSQTWLKRLSSSSSSVVNEVVIYVFSGIPLLFLWSNTCW